MLKIWQFLRSMRFGIIILALILACGLAGSFIPQGNTRAWYVDNYPDLHGALLMLGLDDVFGSWYFIALMSLLCLNLTLCSILRLSRVTVAASCAVRNASRMEAKTAIPQESIQNIRAYLESKRFKKTEFGPQGVYSKNQIGWYGSFLTHLSILLTVIVGAAAIYLPVVADESCMPGRSITVIDGAEIFVDSFSIENDAGELDYASVIRVSLPDGRSGGPKRISVNNPYSFGGYKVYQQTYGTAGAVAVRNSSTGGEDMFFLDEVCFLSLDGVNGVWFEALYPGYVRDEEGNFTLITRAATSYEDPVYQILLASDGVYTPVMAFPGETVSVAGVEYTFQNPVEYPGLRVKKTPPIINALLCAVFALMTLGLWLCFFASPVYIMVNQAGFAVGGPKPQGMELELALLLEDETMGG